MVIGGGRLEWAAGARRPAPLIGIEIRVGAAGVLRPAEALHPSFSARRRSARGGGLRRRAGHRPIGWTRSINAGAAAAATQARAPRTCSASPHRLRRPEGSAAVACAQDRRSTPGARAARPGVLRRSLHVRQPAATLPGAGGSAGRGLAEHVPADPGVHGDRRRGAGVDRAGRAELGDVQHGRRTPPAPAPTGRGPPGRRAGRSARGRS